MSFSRARNHYISSNELVETDESKNARAILMALDQLIEALNKLAVAKKPEDREAPLEIALSRIYLLQKCLDFNLGGDLAKNLFRVYEYARQSILSQSSTSLDSGKIENAKLYITQIREGWSEVVSKVK